MAPLFAARSRRRAKEALGTAGPRAIRFGGRARGALSHALLLRRAFKKKGCGGLRHRRARARTVLESAPEGRLAMSSRFAARSKRGLRRLWAPPGQGPGWFWRVRPRGASPWPRSSSLVQEEGLRQLWALPGQGSGGFGEGAW